MGKLNGTEKVNALLKKLKKSTVYKVFHVFFISMMLSTQSLFTSHNICFYIVKNWQKHRQIIRLSRPTYDDCIVCNIVMARFKPCENPRPEC